MRIRDFRAVTGSSNLFRDEAKALLGADKFIGLSQQRVEGLAGALSCRSISADRKAGHMDEPFKAASRELCSLQRTKRSSDEASNGGLNKACSLWQLCWKLHSETA